MALSTQQESFYDSSTDLYNSDKPHLYLKSKKLPLELRLASPYDTAFLLRYFRDPQVTKYDKSISALTTPSAIEDLITTWTTFTDPPERVNVVVLVRGEMVGTGGFGLIRQSEGKRIGDSGILLIPQMRSKGYEYEALRMLIDYGIQKLGLDRVDIAAEDGDNAMKELMEKWFGLKGRNIRDDRFGNDWLWSVKKEEWHVMEQSS